MPTASVVLLKTIVTSAVTAGADRRTFLARVGIAEETLQDLSLRVPLDVVARAWQLAAECTGDEAFGLHVGERTPFGALDVIDWIARSSATASDAAECIARLHRWLNDAARVTLSRAAHHASVGYHIAAPWAPGFRHATEAALAAYLSRLRSLTRVHVVPLAVRFAHRAPRDITEHRRVFATRVEFGAATSEIVLSLAHADLAIVGGDSTLRSILDRQAGLMLAALPEGDTASLVASCVAELLCEGEPTLDRVGPRVGLTARSLQRRLAAEYTSFQAVLDNVRRDAALGYLADRVEIAEIAARLGYSEPAAFHRAFRRWTGMTPREYQSRSGDK